MRWTRYFLPTLKENPQDADRLSHRLMLRSGLIRKLASGTYSYLPLGWRLLRKVENVLREEMVRAGAHEVLLPAIHPAELWKASGRWDVLGEDMIHFKDRHGKENVLGPTHEEVITDLVRREVHSYRQLPLALFQIQTKFRDEVRPRSGVIRSREFIMKDAYSFHASPDCLDRTYEAMKAAYRRIFDRCGLEAFVVEADPGAMGGSGSQEFVLFSGAGEDRVVRYGTSDRVVAAELAPRRLRGLKPDTSRGGGVKETPTPGASSIESVCKFLKRTPRDLVKTLIYEHVSSGRTPRTVAVLVRGDHEVSEYKITRGLGGGSVSLAGADTIRRIGSALGYSGPRGLNLPLLVDEDVLVMKNFVIGGNRDGVHLTGAMFADVGFDPKRDKIGDWRQAAPGDKGPGGEDLHFKTAIELGHIFKLNTRYSEPLKAHYLDEKHVSHPLLMGCYGIGVNRIVAAAIEQAGSEKGIVWPSFEVCPFQILILPLNMKDEATRKQAETFYAAFTKRGWDVLLDDRDVTAGIKFNDADLMGVPIQVLVGPRGLKQKQVELRVKKHAKTDQVVLERLEEEISKILDKKT